MNMDAFFDDPDHPRLPPDQVRIIELKAEPLPDGRRVRIFLELTPFLNRPDEEISIFDRLGEEVAYVNIIETMLSKIVLTLHLRGGQTCGIFKVIAKIFYSPNLLNASPGEILPSENPEPIFGDQKETFFNLEETSP